MSHTVSDNILSCSYLLLWIATFCWYQSRRRTIDGGSTIMLSYIMYAVFAVLTINDPIFSTAFEPLRLFPYLYLYFMLMTALSPAIYFHLHPSRDISPQKPLVIKCICWLFIASAILMIPDVIHSDGSIFDLFTDDTAGQMAYIEEANKADQRGTAISSLPSVIYNMMFDLEVFLFFYLLSCKKQSKTFMTVLMVAIFFGTIIPVIRGQRGSVVTSAYTIIIGYMCFRQFLSRRINHIVQVVGITGILIVSLPVAAITISRFGNRAAGAMGFVNWYVGQGSLYFNNNALDAGGIRYGDRTFNMAKRLIDPDTPRNYVERRDKYHNLEIDDYFFTTFVGDFAIDFGPVAAVVIFIVFNAYVLLQLRPRDGTSIKLHQLLLLYFTLCICMQGGMTLYSYSDTSNLKVVILALFYAYLRYYEALLKRFPLVKDNTSSVVGSQRENHLFPTNNTTA